VRATHRVIGCIGLDLARTLFTNSPQFKFESVSATSPDAGRDYRAENISRRKSGHGKSGPADSRLADREGKTAKEDLPGAPFRDCDFGHGRLRLEQLME
jgi:hypothetical protein